MPKSHPCQHCCALARVGRASNARDPSGRHWETRRVSAVFPKPYDWHTQGTAKRTCRGNTARHRRPGYYSGKEAIHPGCNRGKRRRVGSDTRPTKECLGLRTRSGRRFCFYELHGKRGKPSPLRPAVAGKIPTTIWLQYAKLTTPDSSVPASRSDVASPYRRRRYVSTNTIAANLIDVRTYP